MSAFDPLRTLAGCDASAALAQAEIKPEPYAAGTRGSAAATDFATRHGFAGHD